MILSAPDTLQLHKGSSKLEGHGVNVWGAQPSFAGSTQVGERRTEGGADVITSSVTHAQELWMPSEMQ
eukprot:753625-Hanusia_phi.AAC.4